MNRFIDLAQPWINWWSAGVLRASIEGAIAIAVVGIVVWFGYLSPRITCWVWRLVCFKLLVALIWTQPVAVAILSSNIVATTNGQLPVAKTPVLLPLATEMSAVNNEPSPLTPVRSLSHITISEVLALLWSIGVVGLILLTLREWFSLQRVCRGATTIQSPAIQQTCQGEAKRLGIRRLPQLRFSSRVDGPLLACIAQPTIILPDHVETAFDQTDVRLMLAHELAHLKRHDLAWNWLPTIVGWLFFFHPLVWLLRRNWSESQEAACDELLLQNQIVCPSEYGRLLLKLSTHWPKQRHASLAAVGVLGDYRNLERRIVAMSRVKKFSRRRVLFAGCILSLIAVVVIIPWRLVAQEAGPTEKPAVETSKINGADATKDTPEATFESYKLALKDNDFKKVFDCLTQDSQDSWLIGTCLATSKVGMSDKGAEAQKLLDKYGIIKFDFAHIQAGQDPQKMLKGMIANVKDKPACFTELTTWIANASNQGPKISASEYLATILATDPATATLSDVKITGDTAAAMIKKKDGVSIPYTFQKINGKWLIDDTHHAMEAHSGSDKEESSPVFQIVILPSKEGSYGSGAGVKGKNQLGNVYNETIRGVTVEDLLRKAYDGTPGHLVIESALPEGKFDVFMTLPSKNSNLLDSMFRQVVEATFSLSAKHESRELESYVLTVKTKNVKGLQPTAKKNPMMTGGIGFMVAANMPMSVLTRKLETLLGKPVSDETELKDRYDVELRWNQVATKSLDPADVINAVSEQLGLQLTLAKRPVDVVVVSREQKSKP